jgi:hypothetical protein
MRPFLQDFATLPVDDLPFPHLVVDNLFEPDIFAELERSYPICPPASGPTGRTIHRGDAEFDRLIAAQPSWRAFFEACHSQAFVDALAGLFAAEIDKKGTIARDSLRFADHVETRKEKEQGRIAKPALPPEAMFVRFDIMQGMDAYSRRAHLDHRRRLATMLIYFDAPGADTFEGGNLVLHDTRGVAARRIAPSANRAVLFPCSERSWHSVDAVTNCRRPRRFVQIAVSGAHDIWPTGSLPIRGPLDRCRRLIKGYLGQQGA